MILDITIDDHVVPQLLTSALEAYEIKHPNAKLKRKDRLETFGLLWGYVISPRGEDKNPRVIVTIATIETSALRKDNSVEPDFGSLAMKVEFMRKYWPHLELVGTFHSHPYDTLEDVKQVKGWQASTPDTVGSGSGDTEFWPVIHKELSPDTPYLAHIIVTITKLKKPGWAIPKKIECGSGFEMSMNTRKLWITSYGSSISEDSLSYNMMRFLPTLDIPSLTNRIIEGNNN